MNLEKQIKLLQRRIESVNLAIDELLKDQEVRTYIEFITLREVIPTAVNKRELSRLSKDKLVKKYMEYIVVRESLQRTLIRKLKQKKENDNTKKTNTQ